MLNYLRRLGRFRHITQLRSYVALTSLVFEAGANVTSIFEELHWIYVPLSLISISCSVLVVLYELKL